MSYFTYVIYSESANRFYKGHCQNLSQRLKEHNLGQTKSIKAFIPWIIVYYEEFSTREKAIIREKYFKSAAGRKYLQGKIKL